MGPVGELSSQPWVDERPRLWPSNAERPSARELERALRTEVVLDLAGLNPPRSPIARPRVLAVGCNDAGFLADVLPHAAPIAIDTSLQAIGSASQLVGRARYTAASAPVLPFRSDSFEIVMLLDGLGRIARRDEATAIREARRVLKPGGRLIVSAATDRGHTGWRRARRYPVRQFARLFDDFTDVRLIGLVPHVATVRLWLSTPLAWRLVAGRIRVCDPRDAETVVGVGVKR